MLLLPLNNMQYKCATQQAMSKEQNDDYQKIFFATNGYYNGFTFIKLSAETICGVIGIPSLKPPISKVD